MFSVFIYLILNQQLSQYIIFIIIEQLNLFDFPQIPTNSLNSLAHYIQFPRAGAAGHINDSGNSARQLPPIPDSPRQLPLPDSPREPNSQAELEAQSQVIAFVTIMITVAIAVGGYL